MKIHQITDYLEQIAPPQLQESYDNCGLLVGNAQMEVTSVLIALDCTEAVVNEAVELGANLIIAHHPVIFSGLKKINGKSYVERVVIAAIRHNIALYALHTNLDNVSNGVNAEICRKLGLQQCETLAPKKGQLKKLVTFIPEEFFEKVSQAVFDAGAGYIGNYSECGFSVKGYGSFKGNELANPSIGAKGVKETVEERRFETIFPAYMEPKVIKALLETHPYEEVAYDIYPLENKHPRIGSGMMGLLPKKMTETEFLHHIREKLNITCIRHSPLLHRLVSKVAVCGGSGVFLLSLAQAQGADFFITADVKYHDFFDAEDNIVIADIGHYESEQFTKDLIFSLLKEKFSTFALHLSRINTNPVNYF